MGGMIYLVYWSLKASCGDIFPVGHRLGSASCSGVDSSIEWTFNRCRVVPFRSHGECCYGYILSIWSLLNRSHKFSGWIGENTVMCLHVRRPACASDFH